MSEASTDATFTATVKAGAGFEAAWIVVRANSAQELTYRLNELRESAALGDLAAFDALVKGAFNAGGIVGGGQAQTPPATNSAPAQGHSGQPWNQAQPNDAPWSQTPPDDPWATPPAQQTQQAPPAQGGATNQLTDKFGANYTFDLPTAPMCQHGPMAMKEAVSQSSGKPYKQWVCAQYPKSGFKREAKTACEAKWVN